ncbi:unnamed protein product [Phytomonas sp. Hart1]|nr:unnamed protein product [Phytomonas sp. Hart1]|eukprot:CCW69719.1 unnamed protein product [Phytomonas sp. isolate Hart1]
MKLVNVLRALVRSGRDDLPATIRQSRVFTLAQEFQDDVLGYLQKIPHFFRLPRFKILVVHARLDPSSLLSKQFVSAVIRMRIIMERAPYNRLNNAFRKNTHFQHDLEPLKSSTHT